MVDPNSAPSKTKTEENVPPFHWFNIEFTLLVSGKVVGLSPPPPPGENMKISPPISATPA